jgi:Zn-dependent peptidase ImmA (M78 family)/transcriptional regulator with XRE-family HTH domain
MDMFSKNLRYYRLKNALSKKDLAAKSNVSAMAITNYENGSRQPNMETIKALASALGVKVSDFLAVRNDNLKFSHGEFRKSSSMTQNQQEFVYESVEEYFSRFYTAIELLGGDVLPDAPECHVLPITGDVEQDAVALRQHLGLALEGPVDDLITILENKGILVCVCDIQNPNFSGMNGFVNDRPYIIINGKMSTERNRSTIVHELAHLMFAWPENMEEKEVESMATAISGAFLFSEKDAIRELGVRRAKITRDMQLVCKEYGISMYLLAKRANLAGIISDSAAKSFYIEAGKLGWRSNEPSRIPAENPMLFEQLVYRAVSEGDISVQRGAELLKRSYADVSANCGLDEVS